MIVEQIGLTMKGWQILASRGKGLKICGSSGSYYYATTLGVITIKIFIFNNSTPK